MNEVSPIVVAAAASCPPEIEAALTGLHRGDVFVELRSDRVETRAAMLDALLSHVAAAEPKLVWIGNPLRSPLTIERVLLQAIGPDADLRFERSPAELAAMLRAAVKAAPSALFIVQQPETLDAEARDALGHLAPILAAQRPRCQFLFCCTSAFRPIEPILPVERLPALTPAEPATEPRSSVRDRLPLLLLLCVAAGGALFSRPLANTTPAVSSPAPLADKPTTANPAAASSIATHTDNTPANDAATSSRTDVAALRREFDAFLAQQPPRMANLTQGQRDALFDEFLRRHQLLTNQNR